MFTIRTLFIMRTETLLRMMYCAVEEGVKIIGPSYIAENLHISKSTAQKMLIRLSKLGLGDYVPKKGFIFNEKGLKVAEKALRKHRLIECMLAELGVNDVCREAEKIESSIGEELLKVLENRYGNRKFCPCGNKIPEL